MFEKQSYIIVGILLSLVISCKSNKNDVINSSKNNSLELLQSVMQDCYDNRKIIKEIVDVEGIVMSVGDFFVIRVGDNMRYQPCELPKSLKNDDKVVFSGEVKEIFQNERRAGRPIVLSKIVLQE